MNTTFIKSLEKVLQQFMENKKKKDRSTWTDDNYALCRTETDNVISYTYHYIYPTNSQHVTLKELVQDYEKYFTNESAKPVSFKIDSKSKRKTIVNLLLKTQLPLEQMDKALKTLVLNHITKDFTDVIRYCAEEKTKYAQQIVVKTMEYMGQISNYNSVITERFTEPLQLLQEFKFNNEQYPAVHNFFKHHKEVINNKNRVVEFYIVNFLKYSVKPEDWHLFGQYCHENKAFKPLKEVAETLFEDNNQLVHNIMLNPSYIKARHPYLSSDNDMKYMVESVLDTFTRKGKDLHIEHGFSSFITTEKIGLHFMSLDTKALDGERIKKIFDTLIDKYVETYQAKKIVKHVDMNHAFDFAFLESITPLKEEKSKPHKI